jgi:AcrR family transcriptional regulator
LDVVTETAYTVIVSNESLDPLRAAVRSLQGSTDAADLFRAMQGVAVDDESGDPKERRRRRILQVAIDLFVRHGYRRTSVEDVARGAHVAKGTVYLHFEGKADLLVAAITHEKLRYARRLQPLLEADLKPARKLELWLDVALRMTAELPLLARLLSGDQELRAALADVDEVLGVRTTELQLGFLSSLVEQAIAPRALPAEALRERAQVLLSLVYVAGNFAEPAARFGLPLERHADVLADLLVNGMLGGLPATDSGGAP